MIGLAASVYETEDLKLPFAYYEHAHFYLDAQSHVCNIL